MNKATKEFLDGVYEAVKSQVDKDVDLQIKKTFLKKLKTMYDGEIITAADLLEYAGSKGIKVDSPAEKKTTRVVVDPCTGTRTVVSSCAGSSKTC